MSNPLVPPQDPPSSTSAHSTAYHSVSGTSHHVQSLRHNPLSASTTAELIHVPIKIQCDNPKYDQSHTAKVRYATSVTIGHIIKLCMSHLNNKHQPLTFKVTGFSGVSFVSHAIANTPSCPRNPVTNFNREHLTTHGMNIQVFLERFVHAIDYTPVTCPHMKAHHAKTSQWVPESCPIYQETKNKYSHTVSNLQHLKDCNHFAQVYGDKPPCRHADQCYAFKRLEQNGNNFDDLCHIQLYRHPPRQEALRWGFDINPLVINTANEQNHALYQPTEGETKTFQHNDADGWLKALLQEVIKNGHEECLHLTNDDGQTCSLLSIVDEKLQSMRHKQMAAPLNKAQMLAIVLFTGTDCNYKMTDCQRNGDYLKWKWFDFCLYNAIRLLSRHETAKYALYCGLNKVYLNKKLVKSGFFKTYRSCSWKMELAFKFLGAEQRGMVMVMDKEIRKNANCCDVSWVSKFPDECEVLMSRSIENQNTFSLKVMDQADNMNSSVQVVSMQWNNGTNQDQ